MTYANDHPVRAVAGRLALDFLNTADWAPNGCVAHEKIETAADLATWLAAVGLPDAVMPEDVGQVHKLRAQLRRALRREGEYQPEVGPFAVALSEYRVRQRPILELVALSALSLLADPREMARIKTCPGDSCGWMFLDETKNARRRWCCMETCGNRAKAARHYARGRAARGTPKSEDNI